MEEKKQKWKTLKTRKKEKKKERQIKESVQKSLGLAVTESFFTKVSTNKSRLLAMILNYC